MGRKSDFSDTSLVAPLEEVKLRFPPRWSLPVIFEIDCGRIVKFECKRTIWSKFDFGDHHIWDPNTGPVFRTGGDYSKHIICDLSVG